MEISGHKYKVFINADCSKVYTDEDLKILRSNFEEVEIRDLGTFSTIISFEPTFKVITNRFSIPDEYNRNSGYANEALPLSAFMQIDEIKSIDKFEYVGENIHRIINQEKTWAAGDFEVSNPKDIILVSEKLLGYLENEQVSSNDNQIKKELSQLILLSEIAQKYESEMWFFDGYHWQA